MDETPHIPPVPSDVAPGAPSPLAEANPRQRLLRRLKILAGAGALTFALTTWLLVRSDALLGRLGAAGPASVVQAQLDALGRGDLRKAYELFSEKYRKEVSFNAFHQLVITHRRMFRTDEVKFETDEETSVHAVLETHLHTEDGQRYRARFTLVRLDGRWWIDDVRWGVEAEPRLQRRV